MAFQGGQISVTTSAQTLTALLATAGITPKDKHFRQIILRIDPASANTVYWGGSGVTNVPANAAGALVAATSPREIFGPTNLPVCTTDELFLVATTGATTVFVSLLG